MLLSILKQADTTSYRTKYEDSLKQRLTDKDKQRKEKEMFHINETDSLRKAYDVQLQHKDQMTEAEIKHVRETTERKISYDRLQNELGQLKKNVSEYEAREQKLKWDKSIMYWKNVLLQLAVGGLAYWLLRVYIMS